MAYPPLPDFETFWTFATQRADSSNDLSHHSCCDVWTTRKAIRLKATHSQETRWRIILARLPPGDVEKKIAFRTMMIEEGWKLQVSLNQSCTARHNHPSPSHRSNLSSEQNYAKPLPLHSGAFTLSQPECFMLPQQPSQTQESDNSLDIVTLKSITLEGRNQSLSQE